MLILLIFISCAGEKTINDKSTISKDIIDSFYYVGQITIVGNEPFTKLGLMTDDSTIHILECDKKIEKTLRVNQGHYYKIFVKGKNQKNTDVNLLVINAEKIKK